MPSPRVAPLAALGFSLWALTVAIGQAPSRVPTPAAVPPPPAALLTDLPSPRPGQPSSPDIAALADARLRAARRQFDEVWLYYRESRSESGPVYFWSRIVLESRREVCKTPDDWVAALEEHRDHMFQLEQLVRRVNRLGMTRTADTKAVDYYHAEADYWLARARAEIGQKTRAESGGSTPE